MERYEILFIIIAIGFFPVGFTITIEDLKINKILKVKKIYILFGSKGLRMVLTLFKSYYNYQLPVVIIE